MSTWTKDELDKIGNVDDRAQDRFLALGVGLVDDLAGPHPGHCATQMRVGVAAPEHGDHLNRLHPPGARRGVPLLRPGQLPVRERPAVAVVTGVQVDGAAAAQEDRVRLVENSPHDGIKQRDGAAEDLDPLGPLAGPLIAP